MISSRRKVYDLVAHGDLEPRNVARVRGGGFRLIDFSESKNPSVQGNRGKQGNDMLSLLS
jgi:hypothetical protein